MIKSMFLYSPCIFAMVAIGISLLRHRIRYIDWWLISLLMFVTMFFFVDAWCFTDNPTRKWSFLVDIVGKVSLMSIMPTAIFWYRSRFYKKQSRWFYYLVYILPAIMLVSLCTLYGTMGWNTAMNSSAYFYWRDPYSLMPETKAHLNLYRLGVTVFNYLTLVEVVCFMAHFGVELVRLMKTRPLSLHNRYRLNVTVSFLMMMVIVIIRMMFGFNYLIEYDEFNVLFLIAFSIIIVVVVYCDICASLLDEQRQLTEHAVVRLINQAPSRDKVRFENLMLTNRWCFKKGISDEAVANELGITREFLASMVEIYYGETFSSWVVNRRIEYAQQLMLDNPDTKQAEIAEKCGFADGSVFSRTFSKEVNMTPREWLLINKR